MAPLNGALASAPPDVVTPRSDARPGTDWRSALAPFRGVLGIAIFFGLWQAASSAGLTNTFLLPSPAMLASAFWTELTAGSLVKDTLASLQRVMIGFVLAALVGVVLGVLLGWSRVLADFLKPIVEGLRPIPPIAWTPIAILWFGIGDAPGYFLVFIGAVFPVFVNTFAAVRNIDRNYVNAALCLGASPRLLIVDVLIPASLPVIFPGLRIALGVGWMCVVAAELIAAQSGLGYAIQNNRVLMQTQNVVVGMITIGILGFLMNAAMAWVERRLMAWK
jgi:NitT/TauT family transport system permease protein/sulfonate transport system permease protein